MSIFEIRDEMIYRDFKLFPNDSEDSALAGIYKMVNVDVETGLIMFRKLDSFNTVQYMQKELAGRIANNNTVTMTHSQFVDHMQNGDVCMHEVT